MVALRLPAKGKFTIKRFSNDYINFIIFNQNIPLNNFVLQRNEIKKLVLG